MSIKKISKAQPELFEFTKENLEKAKIEIKKYPKEKKASALLPLLDLAQRQHDNWIPTAAMKVVSEIINVPLIKVLEVATFYTMFNLEPVGKYFIQLCRTTPCWLRGSESLKETAEDITGCKLGETSSDGLFTLIEVECLGACCNAPMVQINNDYYEDLDKEQALKIIDQILNGENPKPGSYRGRLNSEPENNRKTLMDIKNA